MSEYDSHLLTPDQLQEFAQEHMDWVTACLTPGDQTSWNPQMWIKLLSAEHGVTTEAAALYVPFSTEEEKRTAMRSVARTQVHDSRVPLACVISCEAWISMNPSEGMQPKDDPFRKQVMLVAAMSCEGPASTLLAHAPFQHVNGRIILGDFERWKAGGFFRPLCWYFESWATLIKERRGSKSEMAPSSN